MVQSLIKPTAVNYRFKGRAKGTTFYKRLINSNLQKTSAVNFRETGVYGKSEKTAFTGKGKPHGR